MNTRIILFAALLTFASSPATAQVIPSGAQVIQGTEAPNRGYPVKVISTDGNGNAVTPAVVAQGSTTSGQNGELMQCAILASAPTYLTGTTNPFSCDTSGNQRVLITDNSGVTSSITVDNATAANFNAQVVGPGASGATRVGNPVVVACTFTSAQPTLTTGQAGDAQCNNRGAFQVVLTSAGVLLSYTGSADGTAGVNGLDTTAYIKLWNGTGNDRAKGDTNAMNTQLAITNSRWQYAAAAGGLSNTTTAVTVCPAQGAGLRCYMTNLQLDTSALGVATEVVVRDGAAGTVIWRGLVGTAGVPAENIVFSTPLKGTANTLMEVATLTASVTGSVYVNTQGFNGN